MGKIKQNNIDVTKVIFRKFTYKNESQIIAFFPELPGTNKPSTCENYMHIGQHGSGEYLASLKLATPEEYQPLFKELTAIGYKLKVVKRVTYQMYLKRIAQLA